MSESAEMYMLRICQLQDGDLPVPISRLAGELDISPVSTNQMCRRLAEQGLVDYVPYKGVTLTSRGEALSRSVLRRRLLWRVFLERELGLDLEEAEDVACRLEHATPDRVSGRLEIYLGRSGAVTPEGRSFSGRGGAGQPSSIALSAMAVGETGLVASIEADPAAADFLKGAGVRQGARLAVVGIDESGTLLIEAGLRRCSISKAVAEVVAVTRSDRGSASGRPGRSYGAPDPQQR